MSLLRRLWLSVVVSMGAVLAGGFAISLVTARNYFEQQLQAQASDGAVSLALSMSQQTKDVATLELLVAALFDGGHFRSIRLVDPAGKVWVERIQADEAEDVPAWLIRILPMNVRPGEALVSDGWRQVGKVTVVAAHSYAYRSLWRGGVQLGSLLLAVGLVWGLSVSLLLRWVRRPLDEMTEQAEAIGAGQFRVLAEPAVLELRSVARALNHMSDRVRALFAEQAGRIEALRDEGSHDSGTGLLNRGAFAGELRRALFDADVPDSGCVGVLRITDLGRLNQQLGRAGADEWLAAVAASLKVSVLPVQDGALARIGGAEFGLLLPGFELTEGQAMLERARAAALALGLGTEAGESLKVAGAVLVYRRNDAISPLMAQLDSLLMQAEAIDGVLAGVHGAGALPARGEGAWREMLSAALARQAFSLVSYPVLAADGGLLHQEFMLRLNDGGQVLSAGQFMPAAARVGLVARCDLEALRLAVEMLAASRCQVAVNVSPRSLIDPEFLVSLDVLLATAGADASRISVEISERGLDASLAGVAELAEVLARHGVGLGIEHFGRQLAALPRLYTLRLAYLKLDGSFVAGLHESPGHQRLVKAIVDVARGLDVAVIAEQVHSPEEWAMAASLGVSGMTGPEASRRAERN